MYFVNICCLKIFGTYRQYSPWHTCTQSTFDFSHYMASRASLVTLPVFIRPCGPNSFTPLVISWNFEPQIQLLMNYQEYSNSHILNTNWEATSHTILRKRLFCKHLIYGIMISNIIMIKIINYMWNIKLKLA